MLKKYKKMIMALVCMIAIMTQVVPAYADEGHGCNGNCAKLVLNIYNIRYSSTNGTMHRKDWTQDTRCSNCGKTDTENLFKYESCNWVKYADLGHQGESHRYRLTCGTCHGTYDVSLYCEADWTGRHSTPW